MELRQEQLKEELQHQVAFGKRRGGAGKEDVREPAGPAGRAPGWALGEGVSSQPSPLLLERKRGATFAVKTNRQSQLQATGFQ